jgi:hypothetical protein
LHERAREYVAKIMSMLREAPADASRAARDPEDVADAVFSILTSREFCYLGRTKTEPYRGDAVRSLAGDIRAGEPVRFYYDIGAGYHASVEPETSGLVFSAGFSELCVLAQVSSFCNRVTEVHAPGARFILVIDNVCGLVTNDIPLDRTTGYGTELRALIDETGLGARVGVLVESEEFAPTDYALDRARLSRDAAALQPSRDDVDNVSRFLGRPCDVAEAAERMAKYRQAGEMTEHNLGRVVRGVRMTQRATGGTLGFRPFPGGDSRTQVGEVALAVNAKGAIHPVLLTSRNVGRYRRTRIEFPRLLPPTVTHVTLAEPVDSAARHDGK